MNEIKRNLNIGQHFLINKKIIKKEIEESNISKRDSVIEIGAGEGILTEEIAKRAKEIIVFEVDKRYSKKLDLLVKKYKNLKIIYDDAFNYSWKGCNKIVSNIPYFISEKLIKNAIKEDIPEMVLIIGNKFKQKLEKKNSFSGFIGNLFYEINFILKVEKDSFEPPPKVDSWIVKFVKKEKFSEVEEIIFSILKKHGKIKNAIKYSFVEKGKTKRESKELIKKLKIYENILEKPTSRITFGFLVRLEKELKNLWIN